MGMLGWEFGALEGHCTSRDAEKSISAEFSACRKLVEPLGAHESNKNAPPSPFFS